MKSLLHLTFTLLFVQTAFNSFGQLIKLSNNTNLEYGFPLGNIGVMVSRNDSLWRTDGTAAGTYKYATNVAVDSIVGLGFFGNKIFFSGRDAANGSELWVTDG